MLIKFLLNSTVQMVMPYCLGNDNEKEHIVCMLTIDATFSSSAFRSQLNLRMWRCDIEGQLYYLQHLITDDEPGYLILSAIKFFWREGISPTPFLSDSFPSFFLPS